MENSFLQSCSKVASQLLDSMLSSHWSVTVADSGFTAEDFLHSLERFFLVNAELMTSLTQEHFIISPSIGESPLLVAMGDQIVTLYLSSELNTPDTVVAVIQNLGVWLSQNNSVLVPATPLLSLQSSKVTDLTTPINMTLPYSAPVCNSN